MTGTGGNPDNLVASHAGSGATYGYQYTQVQTTGGSQNPHTHTQNGSVTALNQANEVVVGNSANTTPTNQTTGEGVDNMNPYAVCLKMIKL